MGLEAELIETKRHPIVYAEWLGAPGKPTLLIYGHYDVQPPEPLEPWLSPPFEPTVRDGNLYARGATDDKGQMFTHLKAVEAWLKTAGRLPVNVKFLIEGEEEVGGVSLEAYVAENAEPAGLRLRRHLRHQPVRPGHARDHLRPERTGLLRAARAGRQPRPALGDLRRRRGQPAQCPGDDPRQPEGAGRQDPDRRLLRRRQAARGLGAGRVRQAARSRRPSSRPTSRVAALVGEAGYTTLERKWARPTCDINGIFGGYAGPGPKTVLPCKAGAKLSFRLVPEPGPQDRRAPVPRARRARSARRA